MIRFNDFQRLAKSQALNLRFISGGNIYQTEYSGGDDYKYDNNTVIASGHVKRGGIPLQIHEMVKILHKEKHRKLIRYSFIAN